MYLNYINALKEMRLDKKGRENRSECGARLLAHLLAVPRAGSPTDGPPQGRDALQKGDLHQPDPPGRFDFDLAEFPLFRFFTTRMNRHGRDPMVYSDTIAARDGARVTREWKLYPGPFGFGGASAQALLYDLLQLYVEQGARGSQLQ